MRRLRSSASGCHWTPSAKRLPGSSIASGSSSSVGPAGHRRAPRRRGRRPGGDGTSWRDAPPRPRARRAIRPAGARRGRRRRSCPSTRRWCSWPSSSGRCWCSVPPRATFMICIPRQMPEQRQVALQRAPRRARSRTRRARGSVSIVSGMRLGAVGRRVDVGAAREHEPVERSSASSGSATSAGSGTSSSAVAPARWTGVDVAARQHERVALAARPGAPQRARSSGVQMPITGRAMPAQYRHARCDRRPAGPVACGRCTTPSSSSARGGAAIDPPQPARTRSTPGTPRSATSCWTPCKPSPATTRCAPSASRARAARSPRAATCATWPRGPARPTATSTSTRR